MSWAMVGGAAISVGGSLLGGSSGERAANRAARAQNQRLDMAGNELKASRANTLGYLQPLADAGMGALPDYSQGATLQGFGQSIGDIFGSGALQPLIDERMRSSDAAMGRAGLTRSGGALREAARIPTELGFQLEGMLNQRQGQLVGLGQDALTNQASLDQAYSAGIANILSGQGAASASGILGGQQAFAKGLEGATSGLGDIFSILMNRPQSGGSGGGSMLDYNFDTNYTAPSFIGG